MDELVIELLAEGGDSEAQYRLGGTYEYGENMPLNRDLEPVLGGSQHRPAPRLDALN